MKHTDGDLLMGDWKYAMHICNSHVTMGSGIALFLRQKWPQVYQADIMYDLDHGFDFETLTDKMGNFSFAELDDDRGVFNLYAMWGIGNDGFPLHRNCSYDSLFNALFNACNEIIIGKEPIVIGVPYLMGCCRAGGSWGIVEAILKEIERIFIGIEFEVYTFKDAEFKATSTQPL